MIEQRALLKHEFLESIVISWASLQKNDGLNDSADTAAEAAAAAQAATVARGSLIYLGPTAPSSRCGKGIDLAAES